MFRSKKALSLALALLFLAIAAVPAFAGGPDKPGTPPEQYKFHYEGDWVSPDGCDHYHYEYGGHNVYNLTNRGYNFVSNTESSGESYNTCSGYKSSYNNHGLFHSKSIDEVVKEQGVSRGVSTDNVGYYSSYKNWFRWDEQRGAYCYKHWYNDQLVADFCTPLP